VKKYPNGEVLEKTEIRQGRPKTKFASMEEEMAYLKAEIAYLKKQYPNLHGEERAKKPGWESSKN
jgi:transposase